MMEILEMMKKTQYEAALAITGIGEELVALRSS